MQALGQQVKAACIAGIFFLAGVPELVELLFKVPAGEIDTHVLMTLSCFGALAIGSALEVVPPGIMEPICNSLHLSIRGWRTFESSIPDIPASSSLWMASKWILLLRLQGSQIRGTIEAEEK
jgi:hypothetical protein